MKRMIALLLCVCMLMSLAACGLQPVQKESAQSQGKSEEMSREDKELVADLIGNQDASDLSDEELDQLIDELLEDTKDSEDVVNLSTGSKPQPSVNTADNQDAYDENGAMTKPFDQVYPELIEQEQVAFSGESILIKMASDKLTDGLKAAGVGALEKIVSLEGAAWYEAKLTSGIDARKALAAVRELNEVLLAEYNYEVQTAALDHYKDFDEDHKEKFDKNEHHKDQWHMHHCGIPNAFEKMETEGGSSSVVVAVIDSGVDYTHEDLKDNMWVNTKEIPDNGIDDDGNGYIDDYYGVDIIARQGNGGDTNGHGTHVAGIIAAKNNNTGVLGVAYNVKIMSVKAAMHNGTLNQADIARAVLYAYEMGAQVINMSFGGTACSIAVQDALATAYTRCVLVASAGNNGAPNEGVPNWKVIPSYPAALTYVLGVMSVDENGVESAFTNWDVAAFNGVEYELYAPGENIMSTLPGDQYGYLSGTSMAAPVVSAFAAILRSEFSDPDMYPTKFIYGQLASTSEVHADCLNPKAHGPHNIPQVVDLNAALTKLPKPEVNLQDYAIFDDPKYSEKNNGDGVIDAGETIALGLTLRNRWGMSENTLVTIDTKSAISGLEDPYFTIKNPTVDYGSVGTYSTQDAGRIYTDELLTGWEKPFLIEVAPNCPNDYRFTLNVTIQCENALDEEDTTVYTTNGTVDENVRAGFILPSIIEEDMVLTPDNLYIIPNATVIKENVTVRVMPGTHIQFWSDDANDPYADKYIASLYVEGRFLVEGTKEAPVYIYPSQLMDAYGVDIATSYNGHVSMKYADITNFAGDYSNYYDISYAEHCTFRYNYSNRFYKRILKDGIVEDEWLYDLYMNIHTIKDCVFYRIDNINGAVDVYSEQAERCIFVQCGMNIGGIRTTQDCVFLGNRGDYNSISTTVERVAGSGADGFNIYYCTETGHTYVDSRVEIPQLYVVELGGHWAKIETDEERVWLSSTLKANAAYVFGVRYNGEQFVWDDGSLIGAFVDPDGTAKNTPNNGALYFCQGKFQRAMTSNGTKRYVYEIPGKVLPEDITFREYSVVMDLETAYQISPISTPVQLTVQDFLYESSDETVIKVNETGLITPVGLGIADVWVWSADKAVRNRVTLEVKEYVALEGLELIDTENLLAVDETLKLDCVLTPADTTRRIITYTTSDAKVATVDAGGVVTGVSPGTVTVTAMCEGFSDTVELTVYKKTATLQLDRVAISAALNDGKVVLPKVLLSQGAEAELSWRSVDETVAVVEDGMVVIKGLGSGALVVTDARSGLSAVCAVIVTESANVPIKDAQWGGDANAHYVLLENGDLYQWDTYARKTPQCIASNVKSFSVGGSGCAILLNDDTIRFGSLYYEGFFYEEINTVFQGLNVTSIISQNNNTILALTANGYVYAWGQSNKYGQLGVGFTGEVTEPTLINLDDVVDVRLSGATTWFLTARGELYATGELVDTTTATPILMDTNVKQIISESGRYCNYLTVDGKWEYVGYWGGNLNTDLTQFDVVKSGVGIKDGKVYIFKGDSTQLTEVPCVSDAEDVFLLGGGCYIATASGQLLGFGSNSNNDMAGTTTEDPVSVPVLIPLVPVAEKPLAVTGTNLQENVLTESTLKISFNKLLTKGVGKLYADGVQVTANCQIDSYNQVVISRNNGFAENVNYELVFSEGSVVTNGAMSNTQELRIPFVCASDSTPMPDAPEETPVIYKAILDESIERIWTADSLVVKLNEYRNRMQINPKFFGNAILNPIVANADMGTWFRPIATADSGAEIPFGGNWWGTVNEELIRLQMIDYTDFISYARLMYAPYLTEAPENTFPFVTSVKLFNKDGEEVATVGNEKVTFRITFNRDMDTSIPLQVRFGSAYPYGDYEFEGKYTDPRTWEGTYTLNTLIENGYQYFSISNGCSATEDLELQQDRGRFAFKIDTTAAQALIMQGTATDTGIQLKWSQDDFATLMGYNVYRSDAEDGYYTRLNSTVIPADTMEFFDDTVEPGKVYYYNFTVVQTDMTESEPSGKIVIMSKDTMAPNIYHSPVVNAFTGANLVVDATITDNLNIAYANLYYRITGTETWKLVRMNKLNDKYSAIIPAQYVTLDGIEYYIEAFDGVSYTYKGSAEMPYTIAVQEAIDANALGDVDGDGVITNLDALLLLYAINDKYNMTAEEFARADLNGDGVLWAAEALRILQYVSGAVGSVKM